MEQIDEKISFEVEKDQSSFISDRSDKSVLQDLTVRYILNRIFIFI